VRRAFELGLQRRSDVELRLGDYVEQIAGEELSHAAPNSSRDGA
jgi:hypothetical protein